MNKDVKQLLNLDLNDIEPEPLSDKQKAAMRNYILSTSIPKKRFKPAHLSAAAILGTAVVSASLVSVPAVANQVPFLQSILSYFSDEELPGSYSDLATIINQVESSNGIDIMIEDAVYDGTNIIVTYAIQTDKNLGASPRSEGWIDVKDATAIGGTGTIEKINDTTYAGLEEITPHFNGNNPQNILVKWEPKSFENMATNQQFKGDWEFQFSLEQINGNVQKLTRKVKHDDITLSFNSLKKTDLGAVLSYGFIVEKTTLEEYPFVSVEISDVKDNLGNKYTIKGNGGVSHDNGISIDWTTSIYSLDAKAETLTFVPKISYSKGSGKQLMEKDMDPVTINIAD
ncbi:DUF4179 domain-containing protein [Bacillus sp. OG2]|uniref:DUF4179 domain-containing protein n=1 Tax=Bacillus infantis TaxID=324767 RepID=UPI000B9BF846|nr:hypothetical protein B9K06_06445 [Bacillus sp. OG2]